MGNRRIFVVFFYICPLHIFKPIHLRETFEETANMGRMTWNKISVYTQYFFNAEASSSLSE